MLTSRQILLALNDGGYHSGEDLAEKFGVSRTAVWKHLNQLRDSGLSIESSRGRGYRLLDAVELFDRERILTSLSNDAAGLLGGLQIEFTVDSTNALAMQDVGSGPGQCHGKVIVAEQQLAGRGRRGRVWVSPLGQNIYASLVWDFSGGVASLRGLSLVIGVIVAEMLEAQGFDGVQLKWPNDLIWRGRKLGGILVEMSGDVDGPCTVVAGIGLNVAMSHGAAGAVDQPWVDLFEIGGEVPSKNRLLAEMLNSLLPGFSNFEREGFAAYLPRWMQRDFLVGHEVMLSRGDERVTGSYCGVGSDGSITVNTPLGERSFSGGEVSVRTHADS